MNMDLSRSTFYEPLVDNAGVAAPIYEKLLLLKIEIFQVARRSALLFPSDTRKMQKSMVGRLNNL